MFRSPDRKKAVPIFRGIVYFYSDREKYFETLEYFNYTGQDEGQPATCHKITEKGYAPIFMFGVFNRSILSAVHESHHIAKDILDTVGIDDEECLTYLQEWVLKEFGFLKRENSFKFAMGKVKKKTNGA
jgi:hypothetical protein